ncbi:MAG: hypothetical protein JWO95_1771 [Verrucomicrobiales bacterium]|nr:hypothetical protein [Verrucomicrobiales bacterium]
MAREDFIPGKDNDLLTMHDKFKSGMATYGATLGFTAGEITSVNTDNTTLHTVIPAAEIAKGAAQAAVNTKNLNVVPIVARTRGYAKRAKAHPNYDPSKGAAMGIIGAEDSTDLHVSAPEIKGRDLGGGHVEIQFGKKTADAVWIECKRGTETVHTYLASDTHSPYIDNRPLLDPTKPELRNYRLKFMKLGEVVGIYSEELVINCAP